MSNDDVTHISEQFMLGDLASFLLDEIKAIPDVWQKLSEQSQNEILDRIKARTMHVVRQTNKILATQDRISIGGVIDSVTVKDSMKAVLKIPFSDPGRHELIDSTGSSVQIVLINEMGCGEDEMPTADADQGKMQLDYDPLFDNARDAVAEMEVISESKLQRELKIPYVRAQDLMTQLQTAGFVTEKDHKGVRTYTGKEATGQVNDQLNRIMKGDDQGEAA